jgi:Capsule assembly protein Wzi
MNKNIKFWIFLICFQTQNICAFSQSSFSPIDALQYHRLERLEVKTGRLSNEFHTDLKPFQRKEIAAFLAKIDTGVTNHLSKVDKFNLAYLKNDNWEFFEEQDSLKNKSKKAIFKHFYKNISDGYYNQNPDFDVHVSPILHLAYGRNSAIGSLDAKALFVNTRGVEIRGSLNKKLGFYTMLTENQTASPNYVVNYYKATQGVPYQSFVKIKDENPELLQLDYFNALGYITFSPLKNLGLMFGHDKNFIGSGLRSLIISDFSAPYMQLKLTAKIGRLRYIALLGQMTNLQVPNPGGSTLTFPPKYFSFHHLNANLLKNLNVGLFESVMYGNRGHGLELNYLNPVIFYRFIEGFLGSTDNAVVGADFKWNVFKTVSTYGQFVLDEFKSSEFKKEGWWSKKYAWQLGAKYFDVLKIKNFDLQAEYNLVRPFTFSHFTTYTNYLNYNLPIGHPLGANFKEWLVVGRLQPLPKIHLAVSFMRATKGDDIEEENYGGDIAKNNKDGRVSDYNNYVGQGKLNIIKQLDYSFSFMVKHNMFIDLGLQTRSDSYNAGQNETIYSLALRWNLAKNLYLF